MEQLQRLGIGPDALCEALLHCLQPSPLVLTTDGRFLVTDHNDREVPFTPCCKALYLLFLQHPEGIVLKQISDHRDELLRYYEFFAPTINPQRRVAHVDALISPLCNSLNEKMSIIRRAFARVVTKQHLPFYAITGQKGGVYGLKLAKG